MKSLIIFAVLLLVGCGFNASGDVIVVCPSPSGEKVASLYRISTGQGPGEQEMRINIRATDNPFDDDMFSFAFRFGYDAMIRWQSDTEIRIDYPADSELTHQEMVVFGTSQAFSSTDQIRMIYQESPSTHGHFVVEQRCFNSL